ncbi:MAG TPA: hypothetical protein VGU71_02405 [Candidatus Dormibacteraeota bacterium]|nr:hypothetical protein [Candidatus Dormibacteraeota bacterium]
MVVIGGGQAGSYHARQLLKSVRRGEVSGRVIVVDRDEGCQAFTTIRAEIEPAVSDWLPFLRGWLATAGMSDRLVPAPVAPHLTWEWLAAELGASRADPPRGWGLPYEKPGSTGELYLSAAAWRCPATCVEPAHCPALHGPRDWNLGDLIADRATAFGYEPAVFRCVHLAGGVGAVPAGDLLEACNRLASAPSGKRALVALSSRCHAAVGDLSLR